MPERLEMMQDFSQFLEKSIEDIGPRYPVAASFLEAVQARTKSTNKYGYGLTVETLVPDILSTLINLEHRIQQLESVGE